LSSVALDNFPVFALLRALTMRVFLPLKRAGIDSDDIDADSSTQLTVPKTSGSGSGNTTLESITPPEGEINIREKIAPSAEKQKLEEVLVCEESKANLDCTTESVQKTSFDFQPSSRSPTLLVEGVAPSLTFSASTVSTVTAITTQSLPKTKRARLFLASDSKPPAQPMVAPPRLRRPLDGESEYVAENEPLPSTNREMVSSVASLSASVGRNPAQEEEESHGNDNVDKRFYMPPVAVVAKEEVEHTFRAALKKRGLEIVEQEGDGNCLFRAVSLQVYGDANMHMEVRERCMDFMMRDKEHFGTFVIGESFEAYIARKRLPGVHGNNPEIQAIAELFNRPIEVFTPENVDQPLNIFHAEYKTSDVPIRLSYHDGNHYNAVIDPLVPTAGLGLGLPGLQPGLADKMQVAKAVAESDQLADEMELERALKESEDDELNRALKESAYSIDQVRLVCTLAWYYKLYPDLYIFVSRSCNARRLWFSPI
jgi:hypothetical protein